MSFRARPSGADTARRAPSATLWQEGAPLRTLHLGARAFIPVALAGAVLFSLAPSTPAAASTTTEAQQIVAIAKRQLGDPWRYGASGPSSFDCSGLVRYAFRQAGDGAVIHSTYLRSARSIYLWFRAHGRASRSNPKVGDLVVWGYGSHIGIYIGYGRAISTLTNGVHIHGVFAVTARFTAYLHTGMSTKPAS
jgi:cell wall-associated NlpC family hydrolase